MTETLKNLAYVEGFLTAMAAIMQDREYSENKPGRITCEAHAAVQRLHNVEYFIKLQENAIQNQGGEKQEANGDADD